MENIKAQLCHQENRLMNAEVADAHLGSVWLQQNTVIEQITKKFTAETDILHRQIREVNKARQAMQSKAYPELGKLAHRRDQALQRQWGCLLAYREIKDQLLGTYFSLL